MIERRQKSSLCPFVCLVDQIPSCPFHGFCCQSTELIQTDGSFLTLELGFPFLVDPEAELSDPRS